MQQDNNAHPVSRRNLLKGLGLLSGIAGSAVLGGLASEGARTEAQAAAPAAAEPPVVAHIFLLDTEGYGFGYFEQCLNLGSESELIEHKVLVGGRERVQKIPGRLKWLDPILRRGMTPNIDVWEWHRLVTDGNMEQARRNCTLYALDDQGAALAQWNLGNAWPRETRGNLSRTGPDPYQPDLVEELVLTAESVERVPPAAADGSAGPQGIQVGDPSSGYFHQLEVEGISYGYFTEVLNVGWDVEVIEHKVVGPGGVEVVQKIPGRTRTRDVTLERPLSGDLSVWDWRRQVEQGNVSIARGNGTIVAYNAEGTPTARLDLLNAWPNRLATTAGEDGSLNELLTITFETFRRVS